MTAITININERIVSRVLLALAALFPILFAVVSSKFAGKMGYITGQVSMYIALSVIVLHVILRKKPEDTQNRVILVLGAFMLCYSLYSVFDVWNESKQTKGSLSNIIGQIEDANKQVQTSDTQALNLSEASAEPVKQPDAISGKITVAELLNGLQPLIKQFMDKSVDLGNRMDAIPFDTILALTNITSPDGIQQSRQHLNKFKELIAERDENVSQYWKDAESYFRNANINEYERKQTLEGFFSGKPNMTRLNGELNKAQLGLINEALAILVICEQNMSQLTVVNEQLVLPNQDATDTYNIHLENVMAYGQKAAEVAQMIQNLSQHNVAENKKILDKM